MNGKRLFELISQNRTVAIVCRHETTYKRRAENSGGVLASGQGRSGELETVLSLITIDRTM